MALFAAELGLSEDRIGLLAGMMPFFQALGVLVLPIIARFGSRRVSASVLALRYVFLGLFFVAPVFIARPELAFGILALAMLGFAICRSVAEAALVPWSQEFIPRSVRGRIAGRMALAYLPVALAVSWATKTWLDGRDGLDRFYPVFAIGIVIGIVGALCLFGLRGGAASVVRQRSYGNLAAPLRDRNFRLFLLASALQNLVAVSIGVFLLLYFRDRAGMSSGVLVLMAAFIPVGAALGTLLAGWFVDRYGTKPIQIGLLAGQIMLLLTLGLMGRALGASEILTAMVFFLFGFMFQSGISVANVYMLNVVPEAAKEGYTVLHYSVDGVIGGAATFAAGFLLSWIGGQQLEVAGTVLGNFEVLFVLSAAVISVAAVCFSRLREDGATAIRDFVGHFATGSPLRALWGINRYGTLTSEERRRDLAFAFASSGSLLAKEELFEALRDPSLDVQQEAVRALGHISPHRDVVAAVEQVLTRSGLMDLRYAALEALGRLPSPQSAALVAETLDDSEPLLRARAARTIGDIRGSAFLGRIRNMLKEDPDLNCRLAAASALGKLQDRQSVAALTLLYLECGTASGNPLAEPRGRVVLLAMAKIIGCEEVFAQALRREDRDPGMAVTGLLLRLAQVVKAEPEGSATAVLLRDIMPETGDDGARRALDKLIALRPFVEASSGPAALSLQEIMRGVGDLKSPTPALVILLAVATRRALRDR